MIVTSMSLRIPLISKLIMRQEIEPHDQVFDSRLSHKTRDELCRITMRLISSAPFSAWVPSSHCKDKWKSHVQDNE